MKNELQDLVELFAPLVRLHRDEQYFPACVEWYLKRAESVCRRRLPVDETLANKPVTQEKLVAQCGPGAEYKEDDDDLFINDGGGALGYNSETRMGLRPDLHSVPCYAHVVKYDDGLVDIQYWFFYPFNGQMVYATGIGGGWHVADWEDITVRLELKDGEHRVFAVHFSRHSEEDEWVMPDSLKFKRDTHVIVWAGWHSHASYPSIGVHALYWDGFYQPRPCSFEEKKCLPDDWTSNGGAQWECWNNVVRIEWANVANGEQCLNDQNWLFYNGRWGQTGSHDYYARDWVMPGSPQGPAQADRWNGQAGPRHTPFEPYNMMGADGKSNVAVQLTKQGEERVYLAASGLIHRVHLNTTEATYKLVKDQVYPSSTDRTPYPAEVTLLPVDDFLYAGMNGTVFVHDAETLEILKTFDLEGRSGSVTLIRDLSHVYAGCDGRAYRLEYKKDGTCSKQTNKLGGMGKGDVHLACNPQIGNTVYAACNGWIVALPADDFESDQSDDNVSLSYSGQRGPTTLIVVRVPGALDETGKPTTHNMLVAGGYDGSVHLYQTNDVKSKPRYVTSSGLSGNRAGTTLLMASSGHQLAIGVNDSVHVLDVSETAFSNERPASIGTGKQKRTNILWRHGRLLATCNGRYAWVNVTKDDCTIGAPNDLNYAVDWKDVHGEVRLAAGKDGVYMMVEGVAGYLYG